MQENHLFEYAVIRIVPQVEREEFLNTGVIVYCARKKYLQVRYTLDEARITAFCSRIDITELKDYLCAFERICKGGRQAGPIGMLTLAERFRWLTATRSTVVQTSKTHTGLVADPQQMLDRLYDQMVAPPVL